MNYIKELNAFYDWLETNELSPSAINLWYALLHINNKAGWCHSFCVAESVLHVKTGLSDRTIRKARAELKEKNRIDFCSRKGGRAPVYTITSFFPAEKSIAARAGENAAAKPQPPASAALPPLPNLVQSFAANFHYQPSTNQIQLLSSYIDQDGMDEELVIWAMNDTGQRGKHFEYFRTMLNRLSVKRIHTVKEAISAREEYKKRIEQSRNKGNVRPFRKNMSASPVPEWVGDHQHSMTSFSSSNEGENKQWLDEILEGL
ncbi:DnaD domain protein [Fictibacillus aquaticus]|uniref:DnaB/C C-terminal domain-containing protein n=1 Tax=Fictibacillus aquaticus TaxID=2021314 RepID=A0A235F765_9BACL|nr:DnaD domain protein [Fictibacillus aquaticus]OYD57186.1 hypothetical protein CGZ90_10860 [Fictibacillus aquaticus]